MNTFSFMKHAGKNIFFSESQITNPIKPANDSKSELIKKYLRSMDIELEHIDIMVKNETVTVYGNLSSTDLRERTILAAGNIQGISKVEDHINVPDETLPSRFYTIRPGDTLSKISLEYYDNANKDKLIMDANKYIIKTSEGLYPGLVIRIPREKILDQ